MENLNDLIWTDEDVNENDEASTQGSEMYKVCMVAFCGNNSSGSPYGSCTQCPGIYRTASCL